MLIKNEILTETSNDSSYRAASPAPPLQDNDDRTSTTTATMTTTTSTITTAAASCDSHQILASSEATNHSSSHHLQGHHNDAHGSAAAATKANNNTHQSKRTLSRSPNNYSNQETGTANTAQSQQRGLVDGLSSSPGAVNTGSFIEQQQQRQLDKSCNDENDDHDFITLIHFNDCYNIEPGPKSSGAAGFLTAVNQFRHLNPIILFSGDILSPSFMSTFTKGEQMIPVLNDIGVHCAVFGNHEFDYGVDNLIEFTRRTTFPWLLSNVIDKETSNQLGDGLLYHTIERRGVKFGLIGLIEEEWLSTLSTLDSSDVIYEDFVKKGQELARWLKGDPHHCEYVIALTHFRTPNDIRLADSVPEIDLILGGHDHDYEAIKRPNCYVIKSGTDFREFSLIKLKLNAQYSPSARAATTSLTTRRNCDDSGQQQKQQATATATGAEKSTELKAFNGIDIERIECVSYPPDEQLKLKLEKFVTTIDEKMGEVLGQFNCELDGRFSSIRKFETNLGNFVTDIMLASTHADLAILNSGTLRSDRIHPKGDFTMRDLFNILGYIDPIAVLQATGYHIWRALENGVSQWPKLEGRFPQVSGCSFVFDPSKPPLKRIHPKDIIIGDEPLDLAKHYKLTTKAYLASGKDGYDILKECKTLVPGDESPDLTTSILNHFEAINIVKSNRRTHHRQSIICLSRSSVKKLLDQSTANTATPIAQQMHTAPPPITTNKNNHNQQLNDDNNNRNSIKAKIESSAIDEREEEATVAAAASNNDHHQQHYNESDDEMDEAIVRHANAANGGPSASSPLVGSVAPTPTLSNMTEAMSGSCGGCGSPVATPPTTIPRQARQPRTKRMMSLYEMECEQCRLEPTVEGRIKILGVNWP